MKGEIKRERKYSCTLQGYRQAHIIFYTIQGYMYYPDLSDQVVTQSNV